MNKLKNIFRALIPFLFVFLLGSPLSAAPFLDENTQFVGDNGKPLVLGKIYIGAKGLDPKLNAITIYSDRDLTVVLANPQTLGSDGRPGSKIWIPGQYSFRVDDLNGIQEIQDLDAGENPDTGTTPLSTVQGTNTITAEGTPAITAYVNNEIYTFTAVGANTGAVTLNIDSVGAKSIKRNHNQALIKNHIEQNQIVKVTYNSTDDVFEWTNQNLKVIRFTAGSDIASAATVDLTAATGNVISISGSTGPITAFTTNVGDLYWLTFASTPQITHNGTTLKMPGEANRTMVAGDRALIKGISGGSEVVSITKKDGGALAVGSLLASQAAMEANSDLTTFVTPGRVKSSPGVAKAWVSFNGTSTVTIIENYNVTSVTDRAVGEYTINFTTNFSSAGYIAVGMSEGTSGNMAGVQRDPNTGPSVSAFAIEIRDQAGTLADRAYVSVAFFGDQ